eukprot:CAMPEP_0169068762 /NCGR_PEP_ID=MMETSP1015-20121227/4199_1 /TAXON_ID=342587 /ORGANISM="Karlodinium micrum, Strain CCMP2283" /LENGTH=760 /DNA_ID=CAMNT_0009127603 /DNA_START=42 /DNA_END=2324 /DNA_ORIENTATION=+
MASDKNYQYLALTLKTLREKVEKRLAFEILAGFGSDHGPASVSGLVARFEGRSSPQEPAMLSTDGTRSAGHLHSAVRSHSHSTSPRIPRHPAASIASTWELGAQTLVDIFRARLRQGMRCWMTYNRQNKLQDLHSSVLQALQFAGSGPPKVKQTASGDLARAHARAAPISSGHQLHPPHRDNGLSQTSKKALTEVFQEYVPPSRQTKIQPGASFAGSKYCGHSVRLRHKERHVRAQEKKHGKSHPEVANALLSLAGHHAEKGDIKKQREALQRAMTIQQEHAVKDQEQVLSLEKRMHELKFAEISAAEHARGQQVQPENLTHRRATWQHQPTEKVSALLHGRSNDHGPTSPGHRARDASTDTVLRQLYADQARIDEVIKLASKLWDSGVLAAGPRKPPILKSSLLVRLAERLYHVSMRDAWQHWWRQGSRLRAAQEMRHNKDSGHPQHGTSATSAHSQGSGVWQDPRYANTPQLAVSGTNVGDSAAECQRLRAELQAMEERMAEHVAQEKRDLHFPDVGMSSNTRIENDRLRVELTDLREKLHSENDSAAECQRMRAELRAMEERMEEHAAQAKALLQAPAEENDRLRDELALLRQELHAEREANKHRSAVEQLAHEAHGRDERDDIDKQHAVIEQPSYSHHADPVLLSHSHHAPADVAGEHSVTVPQRIGEHGRHVGEQISGDEQSVEQSRSGDGGGTTQRHSTVSSHQESVVSDTVESSGPGLGHVTTGKTDQTDMTADSDDGSEPPVDDEHLADLLG